MLWFDLSTPKSVLFFSPFVRHLAEQGETVLVTSRGGEHYGELAALLRHYGLEAIMVGEYGGASLAGKLDASLTRQRQLLELVGDRQLDCLISICNVDSNRVAFGLGIRVINFCDLPSRGGRAPLTPVARLTLPLSDKVFHPFCVPASIFTRFLPRRDVVRYDFLDPVLYLRDQTPDRSFFSSLPLDPDRRTICFREEERMASYVTTSHAWVLDALQETGDNIIAIPRYGGYETRRRLPFAVVLDETVELAAVLPFVDLMVGGGGTMNIEAAYWGTPVISTRSFLSHYDEYLLTHGLMHHATSIDRFRVLYDQLSGSRVDPSLLREQAAAVDIGSLLRQIGA
jgi:predicted glycosyltransferase